jgi:hypothetical protein
MPWMRGFEEDTLFRKTLGGAVLASLLLGLLIPLIDLPMLEPDELTKVPERFAKLIRKEPARPLPPPQPTSVATSTEETAARIIAPAFMFEDVPVPCLNGWNGW